ncbi:MAG: hypothetical protein ACKO2K_17950 [Alphaproteobacteria bacterium]
MRDDDRIDFSPLDPFADPERLERAVRAIVDGPAPGAGDRSLAANARGARVSRGSARPISREIVAQGRRALLAACAAAAATWMLVSVAPSRSVGDSLASTDPIDVLSAWAEIGDVPHGTDVLRALEAPDVR